MTTLKTPFQLEREKLDEDVATRYDELSRNPESSKMAILHKVMDEFNIHSESTIYAMCERHKARKEAANE